MDFDTWWENEKDHLVPSFVKVMVQADNVPAVVGVIRSAAQAAWQESNTKEESPDGIPFNEILFVINETLGKNFKATAMHKSHIRARWSEGYRVDDFKRVCEVKMAEWDNDPRMRMYLRPETLFGAKMDAYLNQEKKQARQVEPDWL